MKQTAVEWLAKELESYGDPQFCEIEWEQLDSLIEQSKELEKQQIIDAHFAAEKEDIRFWDEAKQEALEYYNETFKNK
jgi:hypothetical protein